MSNFANFRLSASRVDPISLHHDDDRARAIRSPVGATQSTVGGRRQPDIGLPPPPTETTRLTPKWAPTVWGLKPDKSSVKYEN